MSARIFGGLAFLATALASTAPVHGAITPFQNDAAGRQKLNQLAACVAVDRPTKVRALLGSDNYQDMFDGIRSVLDANTNCLDAGKMRLGSSAMAGALAEYWVVRSLPSERFIKAVAYADSKGPTVARGEGEAMAMCVVRDLPGDVRKLLSTLPGTKQEDTALEPILSKLPDCLGQGSNVKLNKIGIRSTLALASYRLAGLGNITESAGVKH